MQKQLHHWLMLLFFSVLGSGTIWAQQATVAPLQPFNHDSVSSLAADQRGTAGIEFAEGVEVGRVAQSVLDEISGMAASQIQPDILWVHNDSGNPQQEHIFAIRRDGSAVADYRISNARNVDWEDIAVGPGPEAGKSYVYVGDIGDNGGRRNTKVLYRVEEPRIGQTSSTIRADVINLRYPDGPRDAETLLVDPRNGDVYVVGKRDQNNRVYRFAAPLVDGTTRVGEEVARINIHWLTAGDISPDGSRIIIRTTTRNYLWTRAAGESVGAALSRDPVKIPVRSEPQGEAIAWDRLGVDYYTTSERARQPIYYFQGLGGCGLDNGITASGQNCPNETKDKAFDGNSRTKWLTFADEGWIQVDHDNNPIFINGYQLTSANDAPERDPMDWRLLGSQNGRDWVELDRRNGERFSARFQTKNYRFDSQGAFRVIRLAIDSNRDPAAANSTQLAEIQFIDDGTRPDTTPPVITLRGANPMTLTRGSFFEDPGARALDETDGDLSAAIQVSGNVDAGRVGRYALRYDVSDAAGNEANTITRIVNVIDEDLPSGHRTPRLLVGEGLNNNQYLKADNDAFRFYLQGDGNLVLRNRGNGNAEWSSRTHGKGATRFVFQDDGNLVLYTAAGAALWASNTVNSGADTLELTNGGALLLYAGADIVWSVNFDPGQNAVDARSLTGKVMAGYQGWFMAAGDGSGAGWRHWSRRKPAADNISFEMWPDLREYDADELFETSFKNSNGRTAGLYSAYTPKTVERHVRWMKDYGIDGVFVQRFIGEAVNMRNVRDRVLNNVRAGAEQHGRVFANMYDISGGNPNTFVNDLKNDWKHLVDDLRITESDRYLHHNGRPVLSLWGFGLNGRPGSTAQAAELVRWLTETAPERYRVTLKLGVDPGWRNHSAAWRRVYRAADVISPWAVGRFANDAGADRFRDTKIEPDLASLAGSDTAYMPVVFPGFSWRNLKGDGSPFNQIPRRGGRFFWRQVYNAVDAGCEMIYVAMFDEVDEATAMFKLAENAGQTPTTGRFLTLDADGEALPSDWYLQLMGAATKMQRGEIALSDQLPIRPATASVARAEAVKKADADQQDDAGARLARMIDGRYDLCDATAVTLNFEFKTVGMAAGERLLVELWDGDTWTEVAAYTYGDDFANEEPYRATITHAAGDQGFSDTADVRFRAESDDDGDRVHVSALRLMLR